MGMPGPPVNQRTLTRTPHDCNGGSIHVDHCGALVAGERPQNNHGRHGKAVRESTAPQAIFSDRSVQRDSVPSIGYEA